jgi:hypothetical protein
MTRTQTYWNCHYWLDLGNNADSGQFVLGQPENQRNKARDLRLPTVPELFLNSSTRSLTRRTDFRRAAR